MPNHEEHCRHSFKEYGVRGDDIHTWMDKLSYVMGPSHRDERHDPRRDLPMVVQMFGEKYSDNVARQIFLDHIYLDAQERARSKAKSSPPEQYEPSEPSPSCSSSGYLPSGGNLDIIVIMSIAVAIVVIGYVTTAYGKAIGLWWDQWWYQNLYNIIGVFIFIIALLIAIFIFRKKNRVARFLWNLIN